MDAFVGLLDGPRARGAFALRTVMRAPWSLRIRAEAPLTLLAVIHGEIWVRPDAAAPRRLHAGDVALTRGPDHYTVASDPDTVPDIIILPGQDCRDPNGASVKARMTHGVRTWGNDPAGDTVFLVGAYDSASDVSGRLLRALPPLLCLHADTWRSPLVTLLNDEVVKDEPGQAAVLDRLIDLLTIAVVKTWFAQGGAPTAPWASGRRDPVVERALQAMHANPARAWTMDTLARHAGASRAALARRFHERVGEPPMSFLKTWRLALAADLLTEDGATVAAVAEKVGYSSAFAFSAAFKRVRGISPRDHRASAVPGA
jgi:AraC-like DNA-binding protein